jgi:hypothetical protein
MFEITFQLCLSSRFFTIPGIKKEGGRVRPVKNAYFFFPMVFWGLLCNFTPPPLLV